MNLIEYLQYGTTLLRNINSNMAGTIQEQSQFEPVLIVAASWTNYVVQL